VRGYNVLKREARVLGVTGNRDILVKVLYRGKLWFEAAELQLRQRGEDLGGLLKSKYLDQARIVFIDEKVIKDEKDFNSLKKLDKLVIIFREGSHEALRGDYVNIKSLCSFNNVPEALRVAREILDEVRHVIGKVHEN